MNPWVANLLFRQADFLAQSFQSWIAEQQSGTFTVHTEQETSYPDRPNRGAVENFEDALLIA